MTNSLGVSVIEPAVKAFVKAHPTLTINTKNMSVQINGLDVDTHAITSMYAKAGTHEVFVKCILPERAIIDHAPKFIIDIVDSNGVLITAVEAQLNARWLQKSLGKSLVEPVLRAEQLTAVGWASVTVDGDEVAEETSGLDADPFRSGDAVGGADVRDLVVDDHRLQRTTTRQPRTAHLDRCARKFVARENGGPIIRGRVEREHRQVHHGRFAAAELRGLEAEAMHSALEAGGQLVHLEGVEV
jgi:hypothetical protein